MAHSFCFSILFVLLFFVSLFWYYLLKYFSAFGFNGKDGSGLTSFVRHDRDSGMDTGGNGDDNNALHGQPVGGKRRRVVDNRVGPNESPIMPDPRDGILRRRLNFNE